MPHTLICSACRTNVLFGNAATFWLMDGYVVRYCPGCHALVRVVKQESATCTRWGPLRWAGVKYCREQAPVTAVRYHSHPVVHFDYLCEKHRDEPESQANGFGFLMFGGATVLFGILGSAAVPLSIQLARSLFPITLPPSPLGWFATIAGAIVAIAAASVPTIVVLRTHRSRLEDP